VQKGADFNGRERMALLAKKGTTATDRPRGARTHNMVRAKMQKGEIRKKYGGLGGSEDKHGKCSGVSQKATGNIIGDGGTTLLITKRK